MRKAIAATAAVAALSVGSVLGMAYWLGGVATERLTRETQELVALSPNFKLVEQQTRRGLFSSTHAVTLQLGCLPSSPADKQGDAKGAARPIHISWRDVVHHGPFPGGSGVGAAAIDSELLTPRIWQKQLDQLFGKQALVRVHSQIGLRGDLVSEFTLAGLQWSDPAQGGVVTKPLIGRVMGNVRAEPNAAGSYVLDIPRIDVNMHGPDGAALSIAVGRVLVELELAKRADPKLWLRPLKAAGFVSSVVFTGSATGAMGAPTTHARASWDGIKLGTEATLEHGSWSGSYGFTTKGKVNDFAVDKLELAASLKHLEAASFQRALGAAFSTTLSCDRPASAQELEGLLPALQKELVALLVHNPEYALDKLGLDLGDKHAELSYSLGTRGITPANQTTPVPLLLATKGFARANVAVHLALVELLANKLVNYDSKPTQQTPMAATSAIVGSFVEKLVRQGYLQRTRDQLQASVAFEAGQLTLNGKPVDAPALVSPFGP
ncbi:MAG: hypothetical protein JWN04_2625 [Myxococcaceae bacterium]|nr:hypothetical protein [Myxococcaceae bacterium]